MVSFSGFVCGIDVSSFSECCCALFGGLTKSWFVVQLTL